MASIFTKIIEGEIPCYKIAESEDYFAFLDINPIEKGHTLVVPKVEVDYVFDLEDSVLQGLHTFAKKVALCIEQVVECKRVGVGVLGLEVPHAHVHLVPLVDKGIIDFTQRADISKAEMAELADSIHALFSKKYTS